MHFQVKELPPGADAQDIIQHDPRTHRRTRGYSYGGSVQDPRTGEIIKGNVNWAAFGSDRTICMVRACSPVSTTMSSAGGYNDASVNMALDRVRQLSAHEVGHTLGYPHNYLASSYGR